MLEFGALAATQLIFVLYGAGVRRPFGSLQTVACLPHRLRFSRRIVIIDWAFAAFIGIMWLLLAWRLGFVAFIAGWVVFYLIGDALSRRISILPSFYVSALLATMAAAWAVLQFVDDHLQVGAAG